MKVIYLIICLTGLLLGSLASAQDVMSSAPQSDRSAPQGYGHCKLVPGGFHHGAWETLHFKCKKHGSVFVTGFFRCEKVKHGVCRHWGWVPEHWVRM